MHQNLRSQNRKQSKSSIYIISMSKHSHRPNTRQDFEYDALQPMLKKLPPKELISSQYLPDEEVNMKLVIDRDLRRNNISFIPPKVKDNELQTYASHFNKVDYLGHYCSGNINDLVFLKFNNTKYNQLHGTTYKTRVMPAFYVPFHQIYSEDEEFFTKNLGLKFPETHQKALLPNSKYHRGCAFDPIFSSQFLNGNLFAVIRKQPYEYELYLQNDINSSLEVAWFNFSVEFYEVGYYTFRIKNITKNMSKLFEKGLKINFLLHSAVSQEAKKDIGEDWSLTGDNIAFTKTDIQIESRPGEHYYELYFQYRCKNKHDIGIFSLDVPYNPVDSEKFFNNVMYKRIKGMTRIQKLQYGRTISGTPLNAYLIKKKKAGSDTDQLSAQITQALLGVKNRRSINLTPINKLLLPDEGHIKSVFIIARMAGSDVHSSHIIEGMVEYLLDTLDFDSLKRQLNFYFIPVANIDGVKYGNTATNLTGTHLANDWKNTHKIYQAETHSLKQFFNNTNKKQPISAVLSFTAQNQELFSSIWGARNDPLECEDSRVFPYVLSKRNKLFSYENSYFFDKKSSSHMCSYLTETFPKALAYQFNISHFELAKIPDETMENIRIEDLEIKQGTVEGFRNLGKDILANYLEHVKLFEKNTLLRDRWTRELEEIEGKISRREPLLLIEKDVEERFSQKFYQIKPHFEVPSLTDIRGTQKSQKSEPRSNAFLQISKIFQIPFFNEINNAPKKTLQKKVAYRHKKANDSTILGALLSNVDQNDRPSVDDKNKSPSQKKNLFRIEEKKPAGVVLKSHCTNTFNFDFAGAQTPSRLENSPLREKQGLKKEISAKLLRKVDAFKDRYARSKFVSP